MRQPDPEAPRRNHALAVGLVIFALFAGACAFFLTVFGLTGSYSVPGAILLLSAALAAVAFVLWVRLDGNDGQFDQQTDMLRSLQEEVHALEEKVSTPPRWPESRMAEEMRAMRESIKEVVRHVVGDEGRKAPREPLDVESAPGDERLVLLLEPVIDLPSAGTVMYRAQANLAGSGGEVAYAELARKADEGGMRAALDLHILKLALPVLARLLAKTPDLLLLMPLSSAVLASKADFDQLLRVMDEHGEAGSAVVAEFDHSEFSGIGGGGKKGLARLAQRGVEIALAEVAIAELDLASLRRAGVRYLGIDPADAAQGQGPAAILAEFAQFAAPMGFQIICGPVRTMIQAQLAARHGRLGFGPYLAPPRKVRGESQRHTRAA